MLQAPTSFPENLRGGCVWSGLLCPLGREEEGEGRNKRPMSMGCRRPKWDTLDDMDIYSKTLILTLNTEHHII